MCLLWAEMGAVDVAFTEATVGCRHKHCGYGCYYFEPKAKVF